MKPDPVLSDGQVAVRNPGCISSQANGLAGSDGLTVHYARLTAGRHRR